MEGLIGCFVNTVALRSDCSGDPSFVGLLQQVRETTLNAYEYQELPFEKIVETVVKERDLSRSPLFQVMFVLHNTAPIPALHLGDVALSNEMADYASAQVDLNCTFEEQEGGLAGSMEYCMDLFQADTIRRMISHYEQLLRSIVLAPDTTISALPMLNRAEQDQLLLDFNDTASIYPTDKTIVSLFEEQVARTPDGIALLAENASFTYRELDEKTGRLALYLRDQGIRAEMLVPVCMDRSAETIIAILAILKAGGAYVPIDPNYPAQRIRYMLSACDSPLALTTEVCLDRLPEMQEGMDWCCVDQIDLMSVAYRREAIAEFSTSIHPDHLAYVIYTSGSTGKPKGVMVTHGNVVSLVYGVDYIAFDPGDRVLSLSAPAFDATTFEYWGMLLHGGCLIICQEQQLLDNAILKAKLRSHRVNTMWITTGWFNQLVDADITIFEGLSTIITGGEKLSEDHAGRLMRHYPAITFINAYGPTENTTFSLTYAVRHDSCAARASGGPTPIGHPLNNRQVYVLDARLRPQPIGVAGEIYLSGAGLSRGYLHLPELTAERFIEHSFEGGRLIRMYRTGDIGRWLPDGNIEFIGRVDEQVKIRGYRIELGEIETLLQQLNGISQAAVVVKEDQQGNKRLVGYLIPAEGYQQEAVWAHLKGNLPRYMVPSLLVELDRLPLTSNGKLDKKALPDPDLAAPAGDHTAPRNEMEALLTGIWQELLRLERIGVHDDFFALGGHSLLVTRVISAIRKTLHTEVSVRELFLHTTIAALARHIQGIQKVSILPDIVPMLKGGRLPLSSSQRRLWFIDRMEGSINYHIPFTLQLRGAIDKAALAFALRTIIERHEVLRTVFTAEDGEPWQQVLPIDGWQLQETSVSTNDPVSTSDPITIGHIGSGDILPFASQWINTPFDLEKDHLFRAMLIKVSADEHLLIMVLHHIAADGWSVSILAKELVELYQAYHLQRPHRLAPLPVQYGDYALWQRQYLEGGVLDAQLSYWKQKLQDTTVLQLPTDHPRPTIQSTRGRSLFYTVEPSLTAGLEQLSRQEGATLFMTLLAAFNVLLYRYSGQEDICVGSPIANRTRQAIESLIGFFVNTIALRNDLGGDPDFITLLARVKTTLLEAYMHQDAPFDKVVDSVVNDRDMSRTPLFQVMFILQNIPDIPALDLGGVEIIPHMVPNMTAKFDLTVDVTRDGERLAMRVEYCSDLYEEGTIARMIGHYLILLQGIVADPYHKIRTLPMLQEEETQQLLSWFNDTDRDMEPGQSVVGFFEQQAARTPDAIAIVCGTQQCTYRQLNEWGNRLAHYLIDRGIGEDSFVPVSMSRSLGMVTAIIGILKAGAAYVPVDPAYPAARIEYILSDISCRVILTDEESSPSLTQTHMSKALILSGTLISPEPPILPEPSISPRSSILPEELLAYPITTAPRSQRPDRLTYLIYTSGSTGKPKGVEMPDQALVNLLIWQQQAVNNPGPRRVLQFASLNFDVSFQELFYALCFGGSIHLIDEQRRKDMTVLLEQVNAEKITDIFMPYIVLKNLAEHVQESGIYPLHLQEIFTAGEQLRLSKDIETLLDRTHARLHNHYGPSESHVVSAYTVQTADFVHRILPPIGRPISNTRLYILDGAGNLCPIGVPGELYIGGIQVARGYLHLPEMTAERFIADPFDTRPGRRLYKTGDVCCWLSDGNIACLGRKDDQVKIRGHRVEIGEVEAALSRSSLISQCVVLAREDPYGGKRLVAYVVPNGAFDKEGIRNDLQTGLPDHMIPSLFISLPELPLTNNGKVNKRALPEPGASAQDLVRYTPPRNRTEQELVSIWETLLQVPQIGIHDNFFELGGHSLLAMRLQSALRKRLGMEIPIRSIFAHPTIARLGSLIRETDGGLTLPAITAGERPRFIPLSYSQERLWFIDQMEGSVQYHMPLVLRLRGRLDRAALERSIQTIIDRHEVLRTVIVLEDGYSCQRVRDDDQWHLNVIDSPVYRGDATAWRPLAQTLIRKTFDLGRDHMLRADLILLGGEEYVLVMTMHHIASDGWSISILFREFIALYDAFARGHQVDLPELDVQYADYAIWQRRYMSDETLALQLQYWKERLKGLSPLMLPVDHNRPPVKSNRGAILTHQLDKELTGRLRQLSRQQGATLFMTLLAAFKVLLYRYSGQEDICVGSPISGRIRQEVEGLVGFFVNTMALRSDLSGNPTFLALLQQVRQNTLSAYEYQEAPFEKVVDAVVTERDLSRSPLFQVMFILQNTPDVPTLRLGDMELTVEEQDHVTSVFDLNFSLKETSAGLSATIEYCTDLFYADTVARMVRHYEQLLHAIAASPVTHICALPMLDAAGMHQLLHTFNDTAVDYPAGLTLLDLFDAQVKARGEEMAVLFGEEELGYQQLYDRSCRLAYQLRSMGVTKGSLVPLCIERSLEMIVAILGIMRAGGAYVPVDPSYPLERISYILEDTRASLLVCSPAVQEQLGSVTGSLSVLLLQSAGGQHDGLASDSFMPADLTDSHSSAPANLKGLTPANDPISSLRLPMPTDLAYVIYTSGSTGKPKGVLIAHGGVVNLVETQRDLFQIRPGNRLLQFASFGFDASCLEIFHALTAGAVLVLPRREDLLSPVDFSALINGQQLDIVCLPPPYLHNIKETLGRVKTVVCGGEPMNREDARYLQSRGIRFVNAYGPTETTICATCTADPINKDNVVVIGRPIANFQLYILDAHDGLCPPGVPGEICVSGPGLAKGYLFRPELTAQKFVPNPFAPDKDTLMYRTGDLGRWLSDGNIEYLGRIDDQVKVRGYRIEPGEIEYVLHTCELVSQAVVLVKGADSDTRRLVGYIVPRGDFNREGILAYLKRKLPDYMIPSFLMAVADLPRTANGKIDKKALPELDSVSLYRSQAAEGPRNEIEAQLLQIWKDVLGLPQLSIHDNFFASGGNSIIAIRLMAKMKQNFQVSINDLFQHPTVEDISRYVIYEKDHFRNRLKVLMTAYATARPDQEERVAREALAREEMLRQKQDYIQRIRQFQDTDLTHTIPYQKILLLGATGYLGIHLLYELLHRQEADIYVIVRAGTDEAALRRLAEKYTFYFSEPLEKVSTCLRVYKGDISLPGFGMTAEAFQILSREIDCIINAAANVNHYGQYHEFEAANIRPLLSLLDICANGSVKALHHISTTSVAGKKPKGSPDHLFTEADVYKGQMAGNFYTKSKLEAELLLDKARTSGMNINIYRVGHLGFHSRTGRFQENMDNNALYTQIKGFVALGVLPAHMGSLELSNIDQVAGAILQLFDKEQLLNRNYHISNPHVLTPEEFAACLNSYGFETELVNTLTYIERMLEAYETKKDLINRLFLQAELFSEEMEDEGVFQLCYEQTNMLLGRLGFEWGEINEQKVHLMLGYAAGTGFFDPGGQVPDRPGLPPSADAGPRSNLSTTFH
jgi:amino acid adenylation domain-containing protein/thioester reductase-like protein